MSKNCALSFKKDKEGFCNTIVNGKLRVKQTARIEKTLAIENNLQVYNDANIGDTVNTCNITIKNQLIYSEPELINESGETLSQLKSLSFINTNGTGILEDGCCNGLYKQIIKINDASAEWETLSDINGTIRVIAFDEFNNDEGPYIGGDFTSVNGNTALKYLAKYDVGSSSWTSVKSGGDNISGNYINTIAFGPSGDGPYIGGPIENISGITGLDYLAKYDVGNSSWTSIGNTGDIENAVFTISFDKNGDGPYIGGLFINVSGITGLDKLAKWTGSSWTSISGNTGEFGFGFFIYSITFDKNDISPYIGGQFTNVASIPGLNYLAKYDIGSSSWTSIKSSGDGIDAAVFSISFSSSGTGPYIGGQFTEVDGNTSLVSLAKYDSGSNSWTSVKSGGDNISGGGIFNDDIYSIKFDKNDEGPYIGGIFLEIGGNTSIGSLAKYDSGSDSWTSIKSGGDRIFAGNNPGTVYSIEFSPSGTGPYIGGDFTEVGGETANNKLAYWKDEQGYKLTYNDTETLTLTNKGDNATLIYNSDPTAGWVKVV